MGTKGKFFNWLTVFVGVVALLGFGFSPALGEEAIGIEDEDAVIDVQDDERNADAELNWGDFNFETISIPTWQFQGFNSGYDNMIQALNNNRYCTGSCVLEGAATIQTGARIIAWELNAYDGGGGSVSLTLFRCPINSAGCSALGAATVTSGTPGYTFLGRNISHTVDNWNNSYVFELRLNGGGSLYRIVGARVLFVRQVSPAPGSATFWDVPTFHPFHRYVEALARARITSGCGGGAYCVDQPVTRGQMAVFLSRALGLHYPR